MHMMRVFATCFSWSPGERKGEKKTPDTKRKLNWQIKCGFFVFFFEQCFKLIVCTSAGDVVTRKGSAGIALVVDGRSRRCLKT